MTTLHILRLCAKSNGMVFFGSIESSKTAFLAMLAHELLEKVVEEYGIRKGIKKVRNSK